jgi:hypothetical protein
MKVVSKTLILAGLLGTIAGCKLIGTGNESLSLGGAEAFPTDTIPTKLQGAHWAGSDEKCTYVQVFSDSSTFQTIIHCKGSDTIKPATSILDRKAFARFEGQQTLKPLGKSAVAGQEIKVNVWLIGLAGAPTYSSCEQLPPAASSRTQFRVALPVDATESNPGEVLYSWGHKNMNQTSSLAVAAEVIEPFKENAGCLNPQTFSE